MFNIKNNKNKQPIEKKVIVLSGKEGYTKNDILRSLLKEYDDNVLDMITLENYNYKELKERLTNAKLAVLYGEEDLQSIEKQITKESILGHEHKQLSQDLKEVHSNLVETRKQIIFIKNALKFLKKHPNFKCLEDRSFATLSANDAYSLAKLEYLGNSIYTAEEESKCFSQLKKNDMTKVIYLNENLNVFNESGLLFNSLDFIKDCDLFINVSKKDGSVFTSKDFNEYIEEVTKDNEKGLEF